MASGNLLHAAAVTTSLALSGFLIGVLLGVPLGLVLGGISWFSKTFSTIANEMIIGTDVGLGRYIYDAQMTFRIPHMYAAIVMAGVIGITVNSTLSYAVRKVVRWRQFDELG